MTPHFTPPFPMPFLWGPPMQTISLALSLALASETGANLMQSKAWKWLDLPTVFLRAFLPPWKYAQASPLEDKAGAWSKTVLEPQERLAAHGPWTSLTQPCLAHISRTLLADSKSWEIIHGDWCKPLIICVGGWGRSCSYSAPWFTLLPVQSWSMLIIQIIS